MYLSVFIYKGIHIEMLLCNNIHKEDMFKGIYIF
jgi:hypothetical protein